LAEVIESLSTLPEEQKSSFSTGLVARFNEESGKSPTITGKKVVKIIRKQLKEEVSGHHRGMWKETFIAYSKKTAAWFKKAWKNTRIFVFLQLSASLTE